MNKKNVKLGLIAAVFCVGFATISIAQTKKKERPTYAQLLEKMDTNKDGKIAESEVKGPLKEKFSEVDTNKDGFISEEEFKNAPKPKRKHPNK